MGKKTEFAGFVIVGLITCGSWWLVGYLQGHEDCTGEAKLDLWEEGFSAGYQKAVNTIQNVGPTDAPKPKD